MTRFPFLICVQGVSFRFSPNIRPAFSQLSPTHRRYIITTASFSSLSLSLSFSSFYFLHYCCGLSSYYSLYISGAPRRGRLAFAAVIFFPPKRSTRCRGGGVGRRGGAGGFHSFIHSSFDTSKGWKNMVKIMKSAPTQAATDPLSRFADLHRVDPPKRSSLSSSFFHFPSLG